MKQETKLKIETIGCRLLGFLIGVDIGLATLVLARKVGWL
jgi:hypothetical protein